MSKELSSDLGNILELVPKPLPLESADTTGTGPDAQGKTEKESFHDGDSVNGKSDMEALWKLVANIRKRFVEGFEQEFYPAFLTIKEDIPKLIKKDKMKDAIITANDEEISDLKGEIRALNGENRDLKGKIRALERRLGLDLNENEDLEDDAISATAKRSRFDSGDI